MIAHPYETASDSFYFVGEELVMHNKAEYKYVAEDMSAQQKSSQGEGGAGSKAGAKGAKGGGGGAKGYKGSKYEDEDYGAEKWSKESDYY
jgi:hypothetical protein